MSLLDNDERYLKRIKKERRRNRAKALVVFGVVVGGAVSYIQYKEDIDYALAQMKIATMEAYDVSKMIPIAVGGDSQTMYLIDNKKRVWRHIIATGEWIQVGLPVEQGTAVATRSLPFDAYEYGLEVAASYGVHLNTTAWEDWVSYRREIKKPLKKRSVELQIPKLTKLALDQQSNVINMSIQNGWMGLFTDKVKTNETGRTSINHQPEAGF